MFCTYIQYLCVDTNHEVVLVGTIAPPGKQLREGGREVGAGAGDGELTIVFESCIWAS